MQLFHTSDWHLGRLLHAQNLIEDQAYALDQLCALALEHRPDAIIVAGDLYDRPVPPASAITLLDQTLSYLLHDLEIPVLIISGNHDSAERLGFASSALSKAGLHVTSSLEQILQPVQITSQNQSTLLWSIPYIDPETVRLFFKTLQNDYPAAPNESAKSDPLADLGSNSSLVDRTSSPPAAQPSPTSVKQNPSTDGSLVANARGATEGGASPIQATDRRAQIAKLAHDLRIDPAQIRDHQAAYAAVLAVINAHKATLKASHHVLVAHCYAGGALGSDSERPLAIGGSDQVEARLFEGFDYVALGHLHRPQQIKSERIRYSGSLLKYSFSEADHVKSILRVELPAAQSEQESPPEFVVKPMHLSPLRDMRRLSGEFEQIMANAAASPSQDFVQIELTDKGAIHDPMAKLKTYYPNLLNLTRKRAGSELSAEQKKRPKLTTLSEHELFTQFAEQISGETLSEDETKAAKGIIEHAITHFEAS